MKKTLAVCAILAAVFWLVWQVSATACAIVVFELPYLAGILLAGLALGILPVRLLASGLTRGQRLVTATAAGLGLLALIVMLLGLAGFLHARILWLGLLAALAVVGLVLLYREFARPASGEQVVFEAGRFWYVFLLGLVPFLVLTLLCAAIPPGVLWSAEGFGYDVLEYHLQVPKEWFQAGAIHYLPHNVYANFPSNAEMLFLLAMAVKGSPYQAVYLAQLIHVAFAVLFIAGVWVFTRPAGIKPACLATVAAGTCGWVTYLAPLAYVEMGMLCLGVLAVGLIVRLREEEVQKPIRYAALIGLLLGLAAGFKYTALAMIAVPLVPMVFLMLLVRVRAAKAVLATIVLLIVCAAAIGPYLVRNFVWTGNPVFPLAYSYFGGRGWDDAMAQRFAAGHSIPADQKPIPVRLTRLYEAGLKNVVVDSFLAEHYKARGDYARAERIFKPSSLADLPTYGLAVLILPWLVFLTRRQGFSDWLLLLVFVAQSLVWLFATHLQARFTVPWLVVLPFLIARTATAYGRGRFSIGVVLMAALVLGAVYLNFDDALRRYYRHTTVMDEGKPVPLNWFGTENAFVAGNVPGYEYLKVINDNATARTMLLADVRPFYIRGPVLYWTVFNRNDFAAAFTAKRHIEGMKDFITAARPDYILVDWSEANRLRNSYGFEDNVRPNILENLSRDGSFSIRRIGKWGPDVAYALDETHHWQRPAKELFRVTYKAPRAVPPARLPKNRSRGKPAPVNTLPPASSF